MSLPHLTGWISTHEYIWNQALTIRKTFWKKKHGDFLQNTTGEKIFKGPPKRFGQVFGCLDPWDPCMVYLPWLILMVCM